MKKINRHYIKFFFLSLILLNTFFTLAQPTIGIKAGVCRSKGKIVYTNNYTGYRHLDKTGSIFGFLLNWPVSKKFIFRPEFDLVSKGDAYSSGSYTINNPNRYIDVPLNLVYNLNSSRFSIGCGPVLSYELQNRKYDLSRTDFGVNILADYKWPIGFFISLNTTQGLKNVSHRRDYISTYKNTYYALCLGYTF